MSECNVIIDDTILNTEVIIDDVTPNLNAFYLLLNNINNISNNYTQLVSLSSKWQETADEMDNYIQPLTAKWIETADEMDNYVQPLTAKWIETAVEMDTLQESATGNWQDVYEYIEKGIIDAGYF